MTIQELKAAGSSRSHDRAGSGPLGRLAQEIEHIFEYLLFNSRWILAPAYVALVGVLVILAVRALEELYQLFMDQRAFDETRTILQALTVVDVVLVMNLVLMVLFVGYTNFVSVFDYNEFRSSFDRELEDSEVSRVLGRRHRRRKSDIPPWMTSLDYSGLKVQVLGSIIAIASVTTLRVFVQVTNGAAFDTVRTLWTCILFSLFLAAALSVAVINWLKHASRDAPEPEHGPAPGI